MKKKILALFTAAALMAAGVPAGVMAEGTSADKVTVNFSAGVPGAFDMVDEELTVQGDLAEKYFPEIKDNECDVVSFADALVAAHIEKYGKDKVKDYFVIDKSSMVKKAFGHDYVGVYLINGKAGDLNVSKTEVKKGNELFALSFGDNKYADVYSTFDKKLLKTKVGKEIKLKISGDNWGTTVIPEDVKLGIVNSKTGKLSAIKTIYESGTATAKMKSAGEFLISATGLYKGVSYSGEDGYCVGALAKVSVGLDKAKITKAKAKGKKVVLKWKKVTGAKKYEVYKGTKKKGKFKKVATVKKTTYTDKKVKKSKKNKYYFYKVRAIAKADGKIVKGKFSKTVRIKIKKAR